MFDAQNSALSYRYEPFGNLTRITDPLGSGPIARRVWGSNGFSAMR